MNIRDIKIDTFNNSIYEANLRHWDNIIKPLNSLGKFEPVIARIGAIQNSTKPDCNNKALIVYAADNGIVEEGISQSGQEVTAICTEGIAAGNHSVSLMAKVAGVKLKVVDVGVAADLKNENIINKKLSYGSRNFIKEPALTEEELDKALNIGIEMVESLKEEGYKLIGLGEMGIGNTSTSTALACAMLKLKAEDITGRGAGLDDAGLKKKIEVINRAIDKYKLYEKDIYESLLSVGGYDIAAMAGSYLGGAIYGVPIVMDGVISAVAALAAVRINPKVRDYIIPSHMSKEPAMRLIMQELLLEPVIDADMALGEGTGAVLMMQLLESVSQVFLHGAVFEEKEMQPYEHYGSQEN